MADRGTDKVSSSYDPDDEGCYDDQYAVPIPSPISPVSKKRSHQEIEGCDDSVMDPMGKRPAMVSKEEVYYRDVLSKLKVYCTGWEINMIATICPKTCEEAYAKIPSLREKAFLIEELLTRVLATLAKLGS